MVTRAALRPVIWTARVALVSPWLAFVVLIGAGSAVFALLAAIVLVSYRGVGRRRAAVITLTIAAAFTIAIGLLDRATHQSPPPSVQADLDDVHARITEDSPRLRRQRSAGAWSGGRTPASERASRSATTSTSEASRTGRRR